MVSNTAVAHHLVLEYDQAKVVHILNIVLLNVDSVLSDRKIGLKEYQTPYARLEGLRPEHTKSMYVEKFKNLWKQRQKAETINQSPLEMSESESFLLTL